MVFRSYNALNNVPVWPYIYMHSQLGTCVNNFDPKKTIFTDFVLATIYIYIYIISSWQIILC
jgi:hypothetical protein